MQRCEICHKACSCIPCAQPSTSYEADACPGTGSNVCGDMCNDWDQPGPAYDCGKTHSASDPQFLGSATSTGWETKRNDEIDIEIPANCMNTPNVCPDGKGCAGDYSTANFSAFI